MIVIVNWELINSQLNEVKNKIKVKLKLKKLINNN